MLRRRVSIEPSTLLGLLAVLLWSTTVALTRSLSERIGPITAGASVYLTGGVLSLTYLTLRGRPVERLRRHPRSYLLGCGALFVLYATALYLGIGSAANRAQVLEVGLLNYLWPALTVLLSLPILGRRARVWLVPGTILALLGVFLVLTQGESVSWRSVATNVASNPLAYSLGLAAALSWGLYSNLTRRWGGAAGEGAVPLFIAATGLSLLVVRLVYAEAGSWSIRAVAEIAFMGVATSLAYVFWDAAMRKGDAVLVVAFSCFTPFFSMVLSRFYLGIVPGPSLWVACPLIIGGSFLSWYSISGRGKVGGGGRQGRGGTGEGQVSERGAGR